MLVPGDPVSQRPRIRRLRGQGSFRTLPLLAVSVVLSACLATQAQESRSTTPQPSPESSRPTTSATPSPRPSAAGTPTPQPSATQTGTPAATAAAATFPAGCFDIREATEEDQPAEMVVAEDLRDRLPIPDPVFSEPMAYVGTSLTSGLGAAYLDALEACIGADRASMRFGWTQGGSTLGVIPMGLEVDGYSGWQLAVIAIDGNALIPDLRSRLEIGEHDGWTYLYSPDGFAVTASAETLYLMQMFCCVDPGVGSELPTFEEVINDYLDRTRAEPAPMPQ